jgi:hypothetical protein
MKTLKPIVKKVSIDNVIKKMPFGHDMCFNSQSYDSEEAACISPKWLPEHSAFDRYKNSNKGLYRSNDWFQIPLTGKFYIYERETTTDYYTVFEASVLNKSNGDTPLWVAKWVENKIQISPINYYDGRKWMDEDASEIS